MSYQDAGHQDEDINVQPISGTVAVSNFPATQNVAVTSSVEVEVKNDSGNPVPVTGTITTTPSGTQNVNVTGNTTDFATQTTLALIKAKTDNIDVALSTRTKPADTQLVDGSAHTQPISAASLPLPTGAATEATLADVEEDLDQFTFSATRLLVDGSGVTQPVSGPLTDTQLRATPVPISGTITANLGTVDGLALDATLTGGTQKTKIVDTGGTNVASVDATGDIQVDVNNFPATQAISAVSLPLPTGASTEATLALIKAKTDNLDVALSTRTKPADTQLVDGSAHTQPISAVSLPLPTGAATEATLATRLADATFTGRINTQGQKTMAASTPVVLASDQSAIPVSESGTWTVQPGNTPNTSPWLFEQRSATISTYSAAIIGLVAAATPTDIFTITGSGTKTVKILRIVFSATATTETVYNAVLLKRSTANSAGTSTTPTVVPHDSNNAAGTAVVRAYTANPTLGTLVGSIVTFRAIAPIALPQQPGNVVITYDFQDKGQPIVLRGTSEVFALNLNSVTITGNNFDISIEWTEE